MESVIVYRTPKLSYGKWTLPVIVSVLVRERERMGYFPKYNLKTGWHWVHRNGKRMYAALYDDMEFDGWHWKRVKLVSMKKLQIYNLLMNKI